MGCGFVGLMLMIKIIAIPKVEASHLLGSPEKGSAEAKCLQQYGPSVRLLLLWAGILFSF